MEGVGKRLREERERLGLSQADLAAAGGVSELSQLRYESGKRKPDAEYLARVADEGVDPIYVLANRRPEDPWPEQLNREERTVIDQYRSLSKDLRTKLRGYLDALYELSIRQHKNRYARQKGGGFLKVAEDGTEYPGDQAPPGGKKTKKKAKRKR